MSKEQPKFGDVFRWIAPHSSDTPLAMFIRSAGDKWVGLCLADSFTRAGHLEEWIDLQYEDSEGYHWEQVHADA